MGETDKAVIDVLLDRYGRSAALVRVGRSKATLEEVKSAAR
ncbi:hypothetical protein ACTMTI_13315 [Nonomuraea sp. H19]